jgi:hypothetical protein
MWCGAQQTETGLWEGSAGMEDEKDKETDANKHDKEMPQFETEMNKGLEKRLGGTEPKTVPHKTGRLLEREKWKNMC